MNPDLYLMEEIITALKGNKLITDEDLIKLEDKIKKGQLTEPDILLYLENNIIKDSIKEQKK